MEGEAYRRGRAAAGSPISWSLRAMEPADRPARPGLRAAGRPGLGHLHRRRHPARPGRPPPAGDTVLVKGPVESRMEQVVAGLLAEPETGGRAAGATGETPAGRSQAVSRPSYLGRSDPGSDRPQRPAPSWRWLGGGDRHGRAKAGRLWPWSDPSGTDGAEQRRSLPGGGQQIKRGAPCAGQASPPQSWFWAIPGLAARSWCERPVATVLTSTWPGR